MDDGDDVVVRYTLDVDYGQFELLDMRLCIRDDAGHLPGLILDIGSFEQGIPLIVFRQYGDVPVEVTLLSAAPAPLGSDWQDVIEFSVVAGEAASISGWGGEGASELGLTRGVEYRVRYAVSNADGAGRVFDPPYPEDYRLDLWPAPADRAVMVVGESGAGAYWNLQTSAREAGILVNSTVPEGQRFRALVDAAFREHPELREKIRAGRSEFVLGVIAYTQQARPYGDAEPDAFAAPTAIEALALDG